MESINITHILKHSKDLSEARGVVNMVRRFTPNQLKLSYSKVAKENGNIYYTKVKMTSFDIKLAIKNMKKVKEKPYQRCKDFNYTFVIDVLEKVLGDRMEYENNIPNTSDEFKIKYHEIERVVVKKSYDSEAKRERRVSDKRLKQMNFSEAFNNSKYGIKK